MNAILYHRHRGHHAVCRNDADSARGRLVERLEATREQAASRLEADELRAQLEAAVRENAASSSAAAATASAAASSGVTGGGGGAAALPPGFTTPMHACGDVLVARLKAAKGVTVECA